VPGNKRRCQLENQRQAVFCPGLSSRGGEEEESAKYDTAKPSILSYDDTSQLLSFSRKGGFQHGQQWLKERVELVSTHSSLVAFSSQSLVDRSTA